MVRPVKGLTGSVATGDSTHFGTNDLDQVNLLLTGTNQHPDDVTTTTPWTASNFNIDTDLNTLPHFDMSLDYIIYAVGSNYKAKNMKTGAIDSTNTAADVVINQCITNLTGNGGRMRFYGGTFLLNNPLVFPGGSKNAPFNRFILEGSTWGGNVANANTTFQVANNSANWTNRSVIECLPSVGSGLRAAVQILGIMFYHPYGTAFDVGGYNIAADEPTLMGDSGLQRCSFNGFNRGVRIQGYCYHQWFKDLYFTGLGGTGKYHIRVDNDAGYPDKPDFLVFDNIHTSNISTTVLDNQIYLQSNYSTLAHIQTDGWTYNVAPLELRDCVACTIHDYGGTDLNGASATAVGAIYLHQTVTDGCYGNRILNTKTQAYPQSGGGTPATVYVDGGAHDNFVELSQFGQFQVAINEQSGANNVYVIKNSTSTSAYGSMPVILQHALASSSRIVDRRAGSMGNVSGYFPSSGIAMGRRGNFPSGAPPTTVGHGLLGNAVTGTNGAGSAGYDTTRGGRLNYTTGATSANRTGWLSALVTHRAVNPRLRFRFALQQANSANNRLYIGLVDTATQPASGTPMGDTWMDGKNGIALGYRTSPIGGGWEIMQNNATATATYASAGLPAVDTNIHTFEIIADDANSRFLWTFDNGSVNTLSTAIPGSSTLLAPMILLETATTTSYGLYELFTEIVQNQP